MHWLRIRAGEIAAAALVVGVYLAVLWVLPKHVFFHPDEGGKFLQMASTEWDRGIRTTLRYGAQSRDPELRYYPSRCAGNRVYPDISDGNLRFQWPFWFPLLVSPFYAQWGTAGLYVIPIGCGWLAALLAATWVRPYSRALAAGTVLLVGLATPVAYYSFAFLEHTLAAAVAMLGLWLLCRARYTSAATACGFVALMLAAALRVEMVIFALAAGIGWLTARIRTTPALASSSLRTLLLRRETLVLLGALVVLSGLIVLMLPARHVEALRALPEMISDTYHKRIYVFESLRSILINARGVGAAHLTTGAEDLALAALFVCFAAPLFSKFRWEGAVLLIALALLVEVSFVITYLSQAYLARQGLFTVAPFIVLAPYALRHAWQMRDGRLLCLAVTGIAYFVGMLALLFTTRIGYSGDYLVGLEGMTRYVLVLYPVWAALSIIALHHFRESDRPAMVRSGVTLLMLMSSAMAVTYQARGIVSIEENRAIFARWFEQLPHDRPLVTSEWWLGAALAPYFIEHEMYCVDSPAHLPDWVAFAKKNGIDQFTFAVRGTHEAANRSPVGMDMHVFSHKEVDGLQLSDVRILESQ